MYNVHEMIYFKFLISLLKHKWFVFIAGVRVEKISLLRLIIHDYSKFSKEEFGAYARKFYGEYPNKDDISVVNGWYTGKLKSEINEEFGKAWTHHYKNNPHHWQYWIRADKPVAMFEEDLREMIADWFGASRGYTGSWDMTEWLEENLPKIILHPNTRNKVYEILGEFGYYIYHNYSTNVVIIKRW